MENLFIFTLSIIIFIVVAGYIIGNVTSYIFDKKDREWCRKHPKFIEMKNFYESMMYKVGEQEREADKLRCLIDSDKSQLEYINDNHPSYKIILNSIEQNKEQIRIRELNILRPREQIDGYMAAHPDALEEIEDDEKVHDSWAMAICNNKKEIEEIKRLYGGEQQ